MPKVGSHTNWEFEGFKVLTEVRLLLSHGTPVPLTSKAFDTLVLLIANRDRVVTKDELLHSVWPDVAVEEGNLTQQIFLLRRALGETAQQPRYIVTVPGHGYRFTARVKEISDVAPPPVTTVRRSTGVIGAGVVVLLALVVGWAWIGRDRAEPVLDWSKARITKVTESGKATNSAISPDGRYVAYVENDGNEYSLWMTHIATGGKNPVIARQPQLLTSLTFSPDGHYIYFVKGTPRRGGFLLSRVPAAGGLETPVLFNIDTPVSFSPDGRQFAFMRGAGRTTHIMVADAGGSSARILASRKFPLGFAFVAPDWSPDGTVVAAVALDRSPGGRSSIVLLPIDGGSSRELYATDSRIGRVRWLPDRSGLLAVVSETMARLFPPWQEGAFVRLSGGSIWRIAYPDGRAEQLTSDLTDHDICCMDIAANGRAIASIVNSLVSDLWIASADRLDRQLTGGSPVITGHDWLPDDDTIVYRDMSGRLQGVHKDGGVFGVALPNGHKVVGGVSACGDGRYIVFQAFPGNNIWRVTPRAGAAVQLTSGYIDSNPACSPDGQWVVYNSIRPDRPSLWRVPIEGGEPTPLVQTEHESFVALWSPNGRLIYYSTFEWEEQPERLRLLRWIVMSASDRTRLYAFNAPADATHGVPLSWAPDNSGLDYVVTRKGVSNIWRQPLAGGPPVQITQYSTGKIFSFAWSRNGQWLSLGSGVNRSDVVLMTREP